jgi:hypothetical protein
MEKISYFALAEIYDEMGTLKSKSSRVHKFPSEVEAYEVYKQLIIEVAKGSKALEKNVLIVAFNKM